MVDVWLINTQAPVASELLLPCLNESEREQAHSAAKPAQFISRRAALRTLLSFYTHEPPAQLAIARSANGKPFLSDAPLAFSVSHSRHWWALAVHPTLKQLGLDIEVAPRARDFLSIARRYFAEREYQHLLHTPESLRQDEFYAIWTLKEAYLKATGAGIAGGLDGVVIEQLHPEVTASFSVPRQEPWQLHHLQPMPAMHLALAYPSHCALNITTRTLTLSELAAHPSA